MEPTTTERPQALPVILPNIPRELIEFRQWVVWRYTQRDGKWTKPPYQTSGVPAKSTDPQTWTDFGHVVAAYETGRFDGIGFVLSADDPYVALDLDHCVSDGELQPWTQEQREHKKWADDAPDPADIVAKQTYAEISPSGSGIRILAGGSIKKATKHGAFEVYTQARYVTLTGHQLEHSPDEVTDDIDCEHLRLLFDRRPEPKATSHKANGHALDDQAVLDLLFRARNGDKARRLYDGDTSAQGDDHSACDQALCNHLAFYCGPHSHAQIDRLYRASGLMRDKWERDDYRVRTIQNAIEGCSEFYRAPTERNGAPRHAETIRRVVTNVGEKKKKKGKVITFPLTMREIFTRTWTETDNWPRRVDRALFVHDIDHGIAWLEKPSALFGWLASRVGKVSWREGASFVARAEFFAELQRTSHKYRSVETLPHEPRYADHYYACGTVQPGKGDTLNRLIDRFSPATDIDRDLLTAAFVTPAWGGPCGTRPAFVITSDDGRGAGKTTVVKVVGHLWGGLLSFSHNEDINRIKTRMLSPEALTVRACLLDNVKSLRFSWSELEAMITGPVIGGHRMYVGEATRPNTLTWYITLNGASLSTDMAQRSVIIKVKKPKRSATWEEDTTRFVDGHRDELIADCIGVLRRDPFPLDKFTRWASWEKDILQRMPEPADAQTVIVERQGIADAESDAAELLEEYFGDQLSRLHYSQDRDQVFIPSGVAAEWYNRCLNEKQKTVSVGRLLSQMIHEGGVTRLRPNKARSLGGRGFIWMGPNWDANETINTDLIERIERYQG